MTPLPFTLMLGTPPGWHREGSQVEQMRSLSFYTEIAQRAEHAGFDALLLADSPYLDPLTVENPPAVNLESITLFAALASVTDRIGLIPTVSTTFGDPYGTARQLASLQWLSDNRIAANIVTSFAGERNYGYTEMPSAADRYARAAEFLDVVDALWNSWDRDALLVDRSAGHFADQRRIHRINHDGAHFSVEGPLDIVPPPTKPLIMQAGTSQLGIDLAAKYADLVYTVQPTVRSGRDYYSRLKHAVEKVGRNRHDVTVLTGVSLIPGDTLKQARARAVEVAGRATMTERRRLLERNLGGIDLEGYDLDVPLPREVLPQYPTSTRREGRFELFRALAADEQLPLGELIRIASDSSGHWSVIGGPDEICHDLEARARAGTTDGFNIWLPYLPEGADILFDRVVPELKARGLFEHNAERCALREGFRVNKVM